MDEPETEAYTLDLSRQQLKKVPKQKDAQQHIRILLLDENDLQKIENLDAFLKIEKLSISKNYLVRMYGICRLHYLRELDLSFNRILSIEGLKDCLPLRHLNLEGNCIKSIEHLNSNVNLEYLNLGENSIGSVTDLSFLRNLKELYLHGNNLTHLRHCDKYLPISLERLTLAKNNISDLNEICTLVHLENLESITINENPCVTMTTTGADGFDYRPFILNWCLNLRVIDGFMVDPIESLKAEWLYSQGRGRSFRLGEQSALAKHLSSVCPLTGKALENENERKLRLILSKAQQHQRQLQEEISENISNNSVNSSPSSVRKRPVSRIQSPRFSRLSGRQGSTESMVSSYHGNTVSSEQQSSQHNTNVSSTSSGHCNLLMTTSLIENIKSMQDSAAGPEASKVLTDDNNSKLTSTSSSSHETNSNNGFQGFTAKTTTTTTAQSQELSSMMISSTNSPLTAASKMVPVPETLMSPDICPQRITLSALNTQITKSNLQQHQQQQQQQQSAKCLKNRENSESSTNLNPSGTTCRKRSPRRKAISPGRTEEQQEGEKSRKHLPLAAAASSDASDEDRQQRLLLSRKIGHHPTKEKAKKKEEEDDDSDNINVDKLKTIRCKAAERNLKNNHLKCLDNDEEDSTMAAAAAIVIQKNWRGYRTRKKTRIIAEELLKIRTNEYIEKLSKDMEQTKIQLQNERKIQQLQMQAINALWKKVSSMQKEKEKESSSGSGQEERDGGTTTTRGTSTATHLNDNQSISLVHDLNRTCTMLTNQVQQLQCSMRDILNCLSALCNFPTETTKRLLSSSLLLEATKGEGQRRECDAIATQTEISAVHTPQVEQQHFPYGGNRIRPSSLPFAEVATKVNNTLKAIGGDCCPGDQENDPTTSSSSAAVAGAAAPPSPPSSSTSSLTLNKKAAISSNTNNNNTVNC